MESMDKPWLKAGWIDHALDTYQTLVESIPELAADWPTMDKEEQASLEWLFRPTWERRALLGQALLEGRLSPAQVQRLARLDQQLLEQADRAWLCFHFRPVDLFRWGTPLEQSDEPIRLELRPSTLRAWAALTSS